jgi:hypothetical protein
VSSAKTSPACPTRQLRLCYASACLLCLLLLVAATWVRQVRGDASYTVNPVLRQSRAEQRRGGTREERAGQRNARGGGEKESRGTRVGTAGTSTVSGSPLS